MSKPKKHEGRVHWFNAQKGMGYIRISPSLKLELGLSADKDLFVHAQGVLGGDAVKLQPEDVVDFLIEHAARGPRAVCVRVIAHGEPHSALRTPHLE